MALSIMVKFTKPGRLIAQTSYLGRFKPLKKFGKSFLKSVKVYRRILDLAHCAIYGVNIAISRPGEGGGSTETQNINCVIYE